MSVEVVEADGLLSLAFGGTELVLDSRAGGVPKAAHWGSPLGATKTTLAQVLDAAALPPVPSSTDEPFALGLLPEATKGWQGIQGVEGARGDRGAGTRFEFLGWTIQRTNTSAAVNIRLADPVVGLSTEIELEATDGLLRLQPTLTNTSADPYRPAGVRLALPIPLEASEVLDLTGHPLSERRPQRRPLMQEAIVRENRRGRTGHDAATLLVAGVPGFGFERGEVWAVHLAWSGDAELFAQRMNNGCGILGGGELLHPGECTLDTGEALVSPWLYAVHGDGLDDLSHRLHTQILRIHDLTATTRPVTLNVWEAVYFDHRPDRVLELADAAAAVGVERFVLDDGWFRGRRDDTRGLGDWQVDESVWPQGLRPLADHVHDLGMQFGLWFEPEMVSPDSDLARAHPEWILGATGRPPVLTRNQSVLNLADPHAWTHILAEIDARITEIGVDYIKWDHNRDLIDGVDSRTQRPVVRDQTLAFYTMLDELRRLHPGLEIESCSSGGARADLGVLARAVRIWDSDCIDALDRQQIQRWTSLLVPLAMQGTHVGSPVAHTTGRRHSLSFRAATALFGNMGIEWDITTTTMQERDELAWWIALHKHWRDVLHRGRYLRVDSADAALLAHGVIADDASRALFSVCLLTSSAYAPIGRVRLPGLAPDGVYRATVIRPEVTLGGQRQPDWVGHGAVSTGAALATLGLAVPAMHPEQAALIEVHRIEDHP